MTQIDDDAGDEEFAALLGDFDEALVRGLAPPTLDALPASTLRARLTSARECLTLLESAWPGHNGAARQEHASFPSHLGRFELKRELGRGGHGVVFLAFDPLLRREVALKVPRPETLETEELRRRFQREAEVAARLDHPNLIAIHEVGQAGPFSYLVTAYCPGPTLATWLRAQPAPPSPSEAARLLLQLADAVAYMHGQGVFHRDIKPGNILLECAPVSQNGDRAPGIGMDSQPAQWAPKLTDFGLAKFIDAQTRHTRTGNVVGTLAYMAPEQAEGGTAQVGPQADIYALGVVLYECLTGRPTFQGPTEADVLRQLLHDEPIPPRRLRQEVPRDLNTLCHKCLEREPKRRYASASAVAGDLRAFLAGKPILARPAGAWNRALKWVRRRPALAALGLVSVLAVLVLTGSASWYAVQLQAHNVALLKTLDRAETGERRLLEENYAIQIKLADTMQGNDPSGLLGELLNGLRPALGQEDIRSFDWHYLWNVASREFRLRGPCNAVAISPDGKLCAFGGDDGTLRLGDVHRGVLVGEWAGHAARVAAVAFSPDGHYLVTAAGARGEGKGGLIVWDVNSRKELARLGEEGKQNFWGLAVEREGHLVAFRGWDPVQARQEVGLWNWRTGQVQFFLRREAKLIGGPQFSPDGHILAISRSDPAEVLSWDIPSGRPRPALAGNKDAPADLRFAPDGRSLVMGSRDGTIKAWDLVHMVPRVVQEGANTYVRKVDFAPDGKILAILADPDGAKSYKSALTLWNWPDGGRRPEEFTSAFAIHDFAMSPDGQTLALACADRHVHLWRPFAQEAVTTLAVTGQKEAWAVAFSLDSQTLAVGYDDEAGLNAQTLTLWDPRTGRQRANLRGHGAMVNALDFAADGKTLASAGYDNFVMLWDTQTHELLAKLKRHTEPIKCLAFSPDGKTLATGGRDRLINLWDTATRREKHSLEGHTDQVFRAKFSPDGNVLVSAGNDGVVRFWDVGTGRSIRFLKDSGPIMALGYSPSGHRLAIGNSDGVVKLWDPEVDGQTISLIGHTGEVRALAFAADGRTLATGSADRTVRLWQIATGRELLVFKNLPDKVNDLAFSPDGRSLAAALHDGSVRIWHAAAKDE